MRRVVRTASKWLVTVAATVASMYALDAIATMAGLGLVATGLLADLPVPALLAFLVATYASWAIALRANLRANWALLEGTGTSTNALSKLAYDLTGVATVDRRLRRWATAAGYVGTELVKELPYYAGAVGAVVVNHELTMADVVMFLGGANLGATAYEYGLARLTHIVLRRRAAPMSRSIPVAPSGHVAASRVP